MYLNIVFLPLLGSLLSGVFGYRLGGRGAGFITISCVLLSLCISFFAFYEVGFHMSPCYLKLLTWFNIEYLRVN
jgi:NADH-ubiquinone oxidoreductase chain 5